MHHPPSGSAARISHGRLRACDGPRECRGVLTVSIGQDERQADPSIPSGSMMPPATDRSTWTIALIGNPNTGKSTLFGALSGMQQRVGNYPGVTVEKTLGELVHAGRRWILVDLPGTYSLAPRSPDEMVAVDVLLGRLAGCAGARRRALRGRGEQPGAEPLPDQPGSRAGPADGRSR